MLKSAFFITTRNIFIEYLSNYKNHEKHLLRAKIEKVGKSQNSFIGYALAGFYQRRTPTYVALRGLVKAIFLLSELTKLTPRLTIYLEKFYL